MNNENKTKSPVIGLMNVELSACGMDMHKNCHNIILLDGVWNYHLRSQFIGRIRRVGQQLECVLYQLYFIDSLEEALAKFLAEIEQRGYQAIQAGDQGFLTQQDIDITLKHSPDNYDVIKDLQASHLNKDGWLYKQIV